MDWSALYNVTGSPWSGFPFRFVPVTVTVLVPVLAAGLGAEPGSAIRTPPANMPSVP